MSRHNYYTNYFNLLIQGGFDFVNFNSFEFYFCQPNGRFEVGKKICLSMSAHHPETWQPSWSSKYQMKFNAIPYDQALSLVLPER